MNWLDYALYRVRYLFRLWPGVSITVSYSHNLEEQDNLRLSGMYGLGGSIPLNPLHSVYMRPVRGLDKGSGEEHMRSKRE